MTGVGAGVPATAGAHPAPESTAFVSFPAAVHFSRFGYTYPGRDQPALVDVELTIPQGAFVLVAGPSGGGKSTLCRAIVGLVPHLLGGTTSGTVTTLGLNVLEVPTHRLAGAVGYVFQNPEDQIVAQRVEHDVAFGPQNLGLPRAEIRERVDEALRAVGLETLRHRPVDTLSAGQQQRIALAGALALRPQLLVLDEPTSLLDPQNARWMLDLVAQLQRTLGITVVVAEHRIEWCLPHADQVVLVEDGRVRTGPTRAIFRASELPEYLNLPAVIQIARQRRQWQAEDRLPLSVKELVTPVIDSNAANGSSHRSPLVEAGAPHGVAPHAAGPAAGSLPAPQADEQPIADRPTPLLALEGVTFRYPSGVTALRDVSAAFYPGETVGILGVSGSGKTTLAKHLNGLLRPTQGRVLLDGTDTRRLPVSAMARRVGFVFQNPLHQLFADSVREEVALGLRATGLPPAVVAERSSTALQQLGIEHLIDRHPLSLSEGERRRVAIAAALALQPDALVLDEPTLGQDAIERQRLGSLIRQLAERRVCTVLITHEVEFAIEVCDRLLVVQDGQIVADGPPRQVGYDAGLLEAAGLVPPQRVEIAGLLAAAGVAVAEPTVPAIAAALDREARW